MYYYITMILCVIVSTFITIAEITEFILSKLGLAIPEPSSEEKVLFLKLSDKSSIGVRSWRAKKIRENHTWDVDTMGRKIVDSLP